MLAFVFLGLIGLVSIYLINQHIYSQTERKLQTSMTEIPVENPPRVAIVFGAKVWESNELSPVLYDRVITAVELYRAGRVKKLLMSGDNRFENYDEPTAMKQTAVKLGVPESDIVLDFAGRRTYDTCQRAKEIFGVERAILVTQEFHQPRALYLCNNLGIDSIGITADRRRYETVNSWKAREFFARASAWFEINFFQFAPVGGEKEIIRQ
ncbi:MAG: YdcF family protein [Acidobacteriota bacterium]|nr:YdcF family protein [Acidobacteriota bacterium]